MPMPQGEVYDQPQNGGEGSTSGTGTGAVSQPTPHTQTAAPHAHARATSLGRTSNTPTTVFEGVSPAAGQEEYCVNDMVQNIHDAAWLRTQLPKDPSRTEHVAAFLKTVLTEFLGPKIDVHNVSRSVFHGVVRSTMPRATNRVPTKSSKVDDAATANPTRPADTMLEVTLGNVELLPRLSSRGPRPMSCTVVVQRSVWERLGFLRHKVPKILTTPGGLQWQVQKNRTRESRSSTQGSAAKTENKEHKNAAEPPKTFFVISKDKTNDLMQRRPVQALYAMPEELCRLTPYSLCIALGYHESLQVLRDFILSLEQREMVLGAFLGVVLCGHRTRQDVAQGVSDDLVRDETKALLPVLDDLLDRIPDWVDGYVTHSSLQKWLPPTAPFQAIMGTPTASTPGLRVPQPCIFFVCRARHIVVLKLYVQKRAIANYLWQSQKFRPVTVGRSKGAVVDTSSPTLLSVMCNSTEHRTVPLLLELKANVDEGCPIFFSARAGNVAVIRTLVRHKADVNAQCGIAGSAIVAAAQFGRVEACRTLITADADVNLALNDGTTAVYYAAQEGREQTMKVLLMGNGDPNKTEAVHDVSPLYIAASQSHFTVFKLLLENGANVNHRRDTGATALCCVTRKPGTTHNRFVSELLKCEADPNLPENISTKRPSGPDGAMETVTTARLPIQHAFDHRNEDVVLQLIKAKSNLVHNKWTALYAAVEIDKPHIVRSLVHSGVPLGRPHMFVSGPGGVQVPEIRHRCPLRLGVEGRQLGCVKELVLVSEPRAVQRWSCEHHCGFTGTWSEVAEHEPLCKPDNNNNCTARASTWQRTWQRADTEERSVLSALQLGDGGARLKLFKNTVDYLASNNDEVGQREPMSVLVSKLSNMSRYHLCAVAGDSIAMYRSLRGEHRGFHSPNPDGLSVARVAELASQDPVELLAHKLPDMERASLASRVMRFPSNHAAYETAEIKFLIKQAQGCWRPNVNYLFGKPHHRGVFEVLLCAHQFQQQSQFRGLMTLVMQMLRMLCRGYFDYDGDSEQGLRRRVQDVAGLVSGSVGVVRDSSELRQVNDSVACALMMLRNNNEDEAIHLAIEAAQRLNRSRSVLRASVAYFETLGAVGRVLLWTKEAHQAAAVFRTAVSGLTAMVGAADPLTLEFERGLAVAMVAQRAYNPALELLLKIWGKRRASLTDDPESALQSLLDVCEMLDLMEQPSVPSDLLDFAVEKSPNSKKRQPVEHAFPDIKSSGGHTALTPAGLVSSALDGQDILEIAASCFRSRALLVEIAAYVVTSRPQPPTISKVALQLQKALDITRPKGVRVGAVPLGGHSGLISVTAVANRANPANSVAEVPDVPASKKLRSSKSPSTKKPRSIENPKLPHLLRPSKSVIQRLRARETERELHR